MKIEEEPIFHIDEINPTLYNAVLDMNEVKVKVIPKLRYCFYLFPLLTGVPNKVLPFRMSPKFDHERYHQIFFMISFSMIQVYSWVIRPDL